MLKRIVRQLQRARAELTAFREELYAARTEYIEFQELLDADRDAEVAGKIGEIGDTISQETADIQAALNQQTQP